MNKSFENNYQYIKKLEWDSNFFNFNVAFLIKKYLNNDIITEMNNFVKNEKIKLVEYLCDCHDSKSVVLAESNNFHFTDIRLTFERKITNLIPVNLQKKFNFGIAEKKHIEELQKISNNLYVDSRYYFDGNFKLEKINEFYKGWLEKAVLGTFDHECFCIFKLDVPIGFCTIRYSGANQASIGVFGISSEYQGMGFAKTILQHVNNVLYNKGITELSVVTQGRNYPAQRTYQRSGFLTKVTELWYHKWYKNQENE